MSILQRIRSDLDRGLLEHRAKVLLEVIRQRVGELTLGDLREILASKLGQGLAALKLIELTGGTGEATPALPGATRRKKAAKGKAAKAKAKASKGKSEKGKATPARGKPKAGTFGAELLEKVWQTLHAAGVPMTSGELRAALGGSKATMYRAVSELVRVGKLVTAGKPARYSVKAAAEAGRAEAAAASESAATPEAGKKTTKTSAGKKAAKQAAGKKAAKKAGGKQTAKKSGKQTAKKAGAKKSGKTAGAKKSAKAESANPAVGNGASAEGSARPGEGRAQ